MTNLSSALPTIQGGTRAVCTAREKIFEEDSDSECDLAEYYINEEPNYDDHSRRSLIKKPFSGGRTISFANSIAPK